MQRGRHHSSSGGRSWRASPSIASDTDIFTRYSSTEYTLYSMASFLTEAQRAALDAALAERVAASGASARRGEVI